MQRRHYKPHTTSLEVRIAERIKVLKAQAEALPPGSRERVAIERKGRQANTFAQMEDWITSPGLQPPK